MANNINQHCHKLADTDDRYNRLANLQSYFKENYNLIPVLGAEIEFYLSQKIDIKLLADLIGYHISLEKGQNQYEVNLRPSSDIIEFAKEIEYLRNNICARSKAMGGWADFSSKPYANDYGSSMHIHLNFLPYNHERNNNINESIHNEISDIEKYAQILCHYLPQYIDYFLPLAEDYRRLDSKFQAPTHISWGGNNRTVLIRIPDSYPIRLEHRLPSANADPVGAIFAILDSIRLGLDSLEKIPKLEKTYGNAHDVQYNLAAIIRISR